MKDNIISIQSKLIYGYVGNNIAELTIQLHGLDVISFPTVLLSAHTGHKPIHGKAIKKELFDELVAGIEAIDVIKNTSCIISGYIGTEEILDATSKFIQRTKSKHTEILYLCDPVMGDNGLYIPADVAQRLINTLIPICDILTPNHFEIEYILKQKINTLSELTRLVKESTLLKDKTLIVTSCCLEDTIEGQIDTILIQKDSVERITSKKIDIETTGTGDLFMAVLASQLTLNKDIFSAVSTASETVKKALNYAVSNGLNEMNAKSLISHIKI